MKNKNTLLVIVLVFVLLLGGAYVLYDRLGQEVTAEQMIVHSTPVPTAGPSTEETLPKTQPEAETETAEHEEPEDIGNIIAGAISAAQLVLTALL